MMTVFPEVMKVQSTSKVSINDRFKNLMKTRKSEATKPRHESSRENVQSSRRSRLVGRLPSRRNSTQKKMSSRNETAIWQKAARFAELAYCAQENLNNLHKYDENKRPSWIVEVIWTFLKPFPNANIRLLKDNKAFGTDVCVVHDEEELILAWRGTSELQDAIQDISYSKHTLSYLPGVRLHGGFCEQYDAIRLKLRRKIWDIYATCQPFKILITGHSLGGALAQICALDLKMNPITGIEAKDFGLVKVVTFGAPRTGGGNFKKIFEANISDHIRLIMQWDVVHNFPSYWLGFRHTKHEKTLEDPDEVSRMWGLAKLFNVPKMHCTKTYKEAADKTAETKKI